MATVTQQEIAPLHNYLNVTINKEDYLPQFEKALKEQSKKANIPGFRKGMVPASLIRKMYGNSLFVDEVLRTVDKEVNSFMENEKLDIFGQPLPVDLNVKQLDVNSPDNYTFTFEVGMKPSIELPNLATEPVTRYKVEVTEDMLNEEIEKLRSRYGNMSEPEEVTSIENVLNVIFIETGADGTEIEGGIRKDNSVLVKYFKEEFRSNTMGKKKDDIIPLQLNQFEDKEREAIIQDLGLTAEAAADKHFNMLITKVGLIENKEMDEEFFKQLFPNDELKTEEEFRNRLKGELQTQWEAESRNQLHHQLYHVLLNHTRISFPEDFLKRWMRNGTGEGQPKSDEQIEQEFPHFLTQLKWTVITDRIAQDNDLQVHQDDVRQFAKQQLLGYMGGAAALDEEQQWVRDYIDRMMKDRKYVEDAYHRIQTQKMFDWIETQVTPVETPVSREAFIAMNAEHRHEHGEG